MLVTWFNGVKDIIGVLPIQYEFIYAIGLIIGISVIALVMLSIFRVFPMLLRSR